METSAEPKKQPNKIVILLIVLVILLGVAVAVLFFMNGKKDNDGTIGYAAEAKVLLDQESLQAAMDEAMKNAENGNVALRYKNNAYSKDGTNFECFIANSESNAFDVFVTIFADAEMTDQLYLSGLVPPGSGFENITLEHALEPGEHRVYVAMTQVKNDEETGKQVILNQVVHTMDFHVES